MAIGFLFLNSPSQTPPALHATDPELQLLSQYKANLSALHYRHKISQVIGLNAFGYNVSQFAEVATFYWDQVACVWPFHRCPRCVQRRL